MDSIPETIGRYRVECVLGRGAMGVIYKAQDPEIGRNVAIKLVRADLLQGGERADYLARFRLEAQAAGRCGHPNIVTLYDYALHDGNPFLAMEYIDGISLAQAIERGSRFSTDEGVAIILEVLNALDYAHSLGIVHRDIKPANILLQSGGRVKVTDFGIARLDSSSLTQDGSMIGTPSYMSPEQCRGWEITARSDLFSAGIVLFELLTDEKPFPGKGFTEIVAKLLNDEAPDLHGRVPDKLADTVKQALAKSPDARFASAAAMAIALRNARDGQNTGSNGDLTIVMPAAASAAIAPELLQTLQRRLAIYLGPIAKTLAATAARKAVSPDQFLDLLASHIESPQERANFMRDAWHETGKFTSNSQQTSASKLRMTQSTGVSPEHAELARAELARLIGPIARVLVKRAMDTGTGLDQFWASLAMHIERAADRDAFMAHKPTT